MTSAEHEIATKAIRQIMHDAVDAGLSSTDKLIALETVMVIGVAFIAMSDDKVPAKLAYAQELIETMTERAHSRVVEFIQGET